MAPPDGPLVPLRKKPKWHHEFRQAVAASRREQQKHESEEEKRRHLSAIGFRWKAAPLLGALSNLSATGGTTMVFDSPQPVQKQRVDSSQTVDVMMSNLSISLADVSFGPRHALFALPQELQDMIFDFAYPQIDAFQPVPAEEWLGRERRTRRARLQTGYVLRRYPEIKVCELLVSKAFFQAASRAFIGSQIFEARPRSITQQMLFTTTSGIASQYLRSIVLALKTWKITSRKFFAKLPNIKVLTVIIEVADFEPIEPRWAWDFALSHEELRTTVEGHNFGDVAGVLEFHAKAGVCTYAATSAQKVVWALNVERLGLLICPIALKARVEKTSTTPTAGSTPLYIGSKVSFNAPKTISQPPPRPKPPKLLLATKPVAPLILGSSRSSPYETFRKILLRSRGWWKRMGIFCWRSITTFGTSWFRVTVK